MSYKEPTADEIHVAWVDTCEKLHKTIAELEAAIADIKENQFPKRIGKITQDVRKQTAQEILMIVLHGVPDTDKWDDMEFSNYIKERYGI